MFTKNEFKNAFPAEVAISSAMSEAISLWTQLYENKAPWLGGNVKSLNLAATVAAEIARIDRKSTRLNSSH